MTEREKTNFGLIDKNGNEIGTFAGAQPRDAALKAANRGYTEIVLREKGTDRLHYFKGERNQVPVAPSAPEWMKKNAAKNGGKIFKASVEKLGVGHLVKRELADNPKDLFKLPKKADKPAKTVKPAAKPAAKAPAKK